MRFVKNAKAPTPNPRKKFGSGSCKMHQILRIRIRQTTILPVPSSFDPPGLSSVSPCLPCPSPSLPWPPIYRFLIFTSPEEISKINSVNSLWGKYSRMFLKRFKIYAVKETVLRDTVTNKGRFYLTHIYMSNMHIVNLTIH